MNTAAASIFIQNNYGQCLKGNPNRKNSKDVVNRSGIKNNNKEMKTYKSLLLDFSSSLLEFDVESRENMTLECCPFVSSNLY